MTEIHDQSTRQRWIPGYEGLYMATFFGDIISMPKKIKMPNGGFNIHEKRILKPRLDRGYGYVFLCNNGKKSISIHSLIALVFIGSRPKGLVINHIDGLPLNNSASNLEYVTQRQNCVHYTSKKKYTSKYLGVCYIKKDNSWQSQIWINGKLIYLGRFKTELGAAQAYQNALKKIKDKE